MKQKVKKYIGGRVVCIVVMVICVLLAALYGTVQLSGGRQLKDGDIPHIGKKTYIAIVDDRFSNVVKQNDLVFGSVRDSYAVNDVVAVRLSVSDMITVVPNTCGDVAVVQIVEASENTYAVVYDDVESKFHVTTDAVLCHIDYKVPYFGMAMEWMLSPMSFLFWLLLPILVFVLCIVIIAYLKEKYLRSMVVTQKVLPVEKPQPPKAQKPVTRSSPGEEKEVRQPKAAHPLLSGEEESAFPKFMELPSDENDSLASEISKKIAEISAQEKEDREKLNRQLSEAMEAAKKGSGEKPEAAKPFVMPKTTVVYEVGEQSAQVKQEETVSDDDLDLMMLQDKIENIINNNNRRLENEVEQKLRGLGTEKEKAQRELEKTREFFISPEHLHQSSKRGTP